MLKHFAVHDYKGLHRYLVLRFGAGTPGVMSWARDHRKSSDGCTSHLNTLPGCKLWAQYSPLAGERQARFLFKIGLLATSRFYRTQFWSDMIIYLEAILFLYTTHAYTTKYNIVLPGMHSISFRLKRLQQRIVLFFYYFFNFNFIFIIFYLFIYFFNF